jgi:hypothetical protein
MTEYMQTLVNVCFTMVTAVVIMTSISAIIFMVMLIQTMISDYLSD